MSIGVIHIEGLFFIVVSMIFVSNGLDNVLEVIHFHPFTDKVKAQILADKIDSAGLKLDHFMTSEHWEGGSRLTYKGHCDAYSMGMVDDNGRNVI